MGKHDIRNIILGGGILAALYFLFGGKIPQWPPANGGNGNGGNGQPPSGPTYPAPPNSGYETFRCPICGQIFDTEEGAEEHIASKHNVTSIYTYGPKYKYDTYHLFTIWVQTGIHMVGSPLRPHVYNVYSASYGNYWIKSGAIWNIEGISDLYWQIDLYWGTQGVT